MAAKKGAKKGEGAKGVSRYYELSGDAIKSKKIGLSQVRQRRLFGGSCRPAELRQVRLHRVQEIDEGLSPPIIFLG